MKKLCVIVFLIITLTSNTYALVVQDDPSQYVTRREVNEWKQNFTKELDKTFNINITQKLENSVSAWISDFNNENKPRVFVRNVRNVASGSNIKN